MDRKKKIAEIRKSAEEARKTDRSWVDGQDYADDVEFLLDELERLEQERNMYKSSSEVFYERLKKACELEWFREVLEQKQQEIKRLEEECDKLIEGLRPLMRDLAKMPVNPSNARAFPSYRKMRNILKEIGVTVK